MTGVFQLSAGCAAPETTLPKGVEDRTPWSRFGLKGPGTLDWCSKQGVELPEVNRVKTHGGLRLCRLGPQDVLWLENTPDGREISSVRDTWEHAPQGYSSWREEVWAWLHLDREAASAALPRLTAVDLRLTAFPSDGLLQTHVAHQDAVLIHAEDGFDVFFDIAATAQVVHDLTDALNRAEAAKCST